MLPRVAALVYADGDYPEQVIARAVERLRDRGTGLAGTMQRAPADIAGRHPCDLLIEDLATGEVTAIAESRGRLARGCRLDVGVLNDLAGAVLGSLQAAVPRLLVIDKFGRIEADGGGLRPAIGVALERDVPVLVGVPARNLDRWRAYAGPFAIELPPHDAALARWLAAHGMPTEPAVAVPAMAAAPWTT